MIETYIGLGANLTDPISHLLEAKRYLQDSGQVSNVKMSNLYLSAPVGYAQQNDFVNAVISCMVSCEAFELLKQLQAIEQVMGRERNPSNQNAPRTIDLDVLIYGSQVIESPTLNVPHPRMFERRFVLLPLLEVISIDHTLQRKVEMALDSLENSIEQRIDVLSC